MSIYLPHKPPAEEYDDHDNDQGDEDRSDGDELVIHHRTYSQASGRTN